MTSFVRSSKFVNMDGIVPGVFSDRAKAEASLIELREIGFSDDELGVLVTDPETHHLIDDSTAQALKGLGHGVLVGAPLGAIAGLALAAIAAPGIGVIGVGGALLFSGHIGALWGAVTGAYLGLTAEIHHLEDIEQKYQIALKPNEILVVVVSDSDRADTACEIMTKNGATCLRETVESQPHAPFSLNPRPAASAT